MLKQTKKQVAEATRQLDSTASSIKTFKAQVTFYSSKVTRGEAALPCLLKEIEEIEAGLPIWRDKVCVYTLSLETHRKQMAKQIQTLRLLKEKSKILEELKKLEANT